MTAHRAVVLWQRSKQARTTWHDDTKDGAQWSAIVSLAGGVTQLEVAGSAPYDFAPHPGSALLFDSALVHQTGKTGVGVVKLVVFFQ